MKSGGTNAAFAMPLVFPVILLLILGAVTLVSRSTSSFLAASKQSDGQAARQAAESGLNRVLRILSPYAKNKDDPYMSFLLLSAWTPGQGVQGSGWALTKSSRSAVEATLRSCRISTRGMRPDNLVPNTTSLYDRLITDVIGTTANGTRTLKYRIVDYTPPEGVGSSKPWPSQCSDFTTVAGGSAQITIEGTVELNGQVLSSQRITRTIEVETVPFLNLPLSFSAPGPPIALRIRNQGTGLGSVTTYVYKDFIQDPTPFQLVNNIGSLRPQCLSCSPSLLNGTTNFFPLDSTTNIPVDLPYLPSPSTTLPSPQDLTLSTTGYTLIDDQVVNPSSANYRSNCVLTRNASEISCSFNSISVPASSPGVVTTYTPQVATLRVDTSKYPINLYIYGRLGGSPGGTASNTPPPAGSPLNPPPPIANLDDGRVAIEHCIKNCNTNSPTFYDHTTSASGFYNNRQLWSRLRVFGLSANQKFLIAARATPTSPSVSLHGSFVWMNPDWTNAPSSALIYGLPTYTYDSLMGTWSSASEPAPSDILATWWVDNLTLNLAGSLKFILPIYGDPEPLNSILPGSYCLTVPYCASGTSTEDPRFPVYPFLPRPKSTL